jgi:hypothetical protein
VNKEPSANSHVNPYTSLTPDFVLDALADTGLMGDGRLTALSSYENRVYQIHLETERTPTQTDGTPVPDSVVAKFYRPGRWADAQIQEEHDFAAELVAAEVPVVPPLNLQGRTLHQMAFANGAKRSETTASGFSMNQKGFPFQSVSGVVDALLSWTTMKCWNGLVVFWRAFTLWVLPSHFTIDLHSASIPSCKSPKIGCPRTKPFRWKLSAHGKTLGSKP